MRWVPLVLLLGALPLEAQEPPAVERLLQPWQVVAYAADDADRYGDGATYLRYLDASNILAEVEAPIGGINLGGRFFEGGELIPAKTLAKMKIEERLKLGLLSRADFNAVLSTHTNFFSHETDLIALEAVPGTDGMLLRLDLKKLGIDRFVFGRLRFVDPWFHIQEDKVVGTGKKAKKQKVATLAPWASVGAGRAALNRLVRRTGSAVPIVRADFFLHRSAIQDDRGNPGEGTGYYDFQGIANKKGFEKRINFDVRTSAKREHFRVLHKSDILQNGPRKIIADQIIDGWYLHTEDSAFAQDDRNPLVVNPNAKLKFDATEAFAPLLNGLPIWLLANAKGELQAVAPPNLVKGDDTSTHGDRRLHVNLSCVRCHASGKDEDFIKPFNPAFISGFENFTPDQVIELNRQYKRPYEKVLRDRLTYAVAIAQASGGMTPREFAIAYEKAFQWYENAKVDMKRAARDLGTTPAHLKAGLSRVAAEYRRNPSQNPPLHPNLTILLSGVDPLTIRSWKEVVEFAHDALLTVPRPKDGG